MTLGLSFGTPEAAFPAYGVPPVKLRPSDYHGVSTTTYTPGVQFRVVTKYVQALSNRTIAPPEYLRTPHKESP